MEKGPPTTAQGKRQTEMVEARKIFGLQHDPNRITYEAHRYVGMPPSCTPNTPKS